MKPTPKYDFPIRVRQEGWEHDRDDQPCYDGIFLVTLNFTVDLRFVPDFARGHGPWPPLVVPPEAPLTPRLARVLLAESTDYAITPDRERAGEEEQLIRTVQDQFSGVLETYPSTIFYVTPAQFAAFQQELLPLTDLSHNLYAGQPVSTLQDRAFVQFILEHVIRSARFQPYHRRMLGR